LAIVDKLGTVAQWERFLPQFSDFLEQVGLLLVLDNPETLLTAEGKWRDPRWSPLIATLIGHSGESRALLTSRITPAGLDPAPVLVEPVHALSRDEAALLAREAQRRGRWEDALDLNAEALISTRLRGASAHEVVGLLFKDYGPLLGLGRLDEAEEILLTCQQVYEDGGDVPRLAKVLSARAVVEGGRGRPREAISLAKTALRLIYLRPRPDDVGPLHHNLAVLLSEISADPGHLLDRVAEAAQPEEPSE
jgi:hypothetical protein